MAPPSLPDAPAATPWRPVGLAPGSHRVPVQRAEVITRDGLVKALVDAHDGVVALRAPAGYGKTTAAVLWEAADDRPFAWASLEGADDDPVHLLQHLGWALHEVDPLPAHVARLLRDPTQPPLRTMLPALLTVMAARTRSVLVLDDIHQVASNASVNCLQALIDQLPDPWTLAIVGRTAGGLSLSRRRMEGTLLELGEADLAMGSDEARRLLDAMAVHLPDEQIEDLVARTEGWAGGLHLAGLRLRDRRPGTGALLSGRDRLVADYLVEEVLAGLPADTVAFLERSAVLDRMNGPLLDELLGRHDSEQMLHGLEDSGNLLLVPLDDGRGWYRYHHLFGELLRSRLGKRDPTELRALHRHASRLLEGEGDVGTALAHAVAGADPARAAALVRSRADELVLCGHPTVLATWLERLGPDSLERDASAALAWAWLGVATVDIGLVQRATSAARALAGEDPDVQIACATVNAIVGIGGLAGVLDQTEQALQAAGPDAAARCGLALGIRGTGLAMVGRTDEARAALVQSRPAMARLPAFAAGIEAHLALLALDDGDVGTAQGCVDRIDAIRRNHDIERLPAAMVAFAASALVRATVGRGDEVVGDHAIAEQLLDHLDGAVPRSALLGHVVLARTALLVDDIDGATRHLRGAETARREEPLAARLNLQIDLLRDRLAEVAATRAGAPRLTPAERRLLPHLATHRSLREIADELIISRNTAKSHAVAIYRKLGATSRTEAVTNARRCGLLAD